MKSIKELLEDFKDKEVQKFEKSERAELVKKFVTKLNAERKVNGFKPLPASFIAIKMAEAQLSTNDLYWFYKYCDEAKSFSSCWWWSLDGKNAKEISSL